jgi:hypothetical protein
MLRDKVEGKTALTGQQAVQGLQNQLGPQAATEQLRQAGIPGVRYLDQASRAAGEGSRNYVVFDDSLIQIVRKYGIPGAIGLGLITPEMGRQMEEQGL